MEALKAAASYDRLIQNFKWENWATRPSLSPDCSSVLNAQETIPIAAGHSGST
jgi:hypothetical protein